MFDHAINEVSKFTRPIHSILRNYGSIEIIPSTSTLFFINEEGYALTCKHVVAGLLQPADQVNQIYQCYKQEFSTIPQSGNKKRIAIKNLENKYGYTNETTIQVKNSFINCVDKMLPLSYNLHPIYDLAVIKFNGYSSLLCNEFPVFKKDSSQIKTGEYLCRLGFPFPEFNNYQYNSNLDDIEWLSTGDSSSPIFPIDGMVTRFAALDGKISEIEMSSPGLKGQSGGPLFNKEGIVYGMQSSTISLHLGFDIVNKEIAVNNKKKKVSDFSFIHLGRCIHVDVIKDFLKSLNIKFYEE
ncbi:trypsin-like peptidase domain-containing protein [Bacteroidaceae bacterium HV4-6-C5C]|nr:trypsin-like peptidase domain-containing protein [Bacteroidaceae bacterium HV4-6-C5C]